MARIMDPKKKKEELEKMERKLAQQTARFEALKRKMAIEERKRDTRRKILAGALVLNAYADERTPQIHKDFLKELLEKGLTQPRDLELFDFLIEEHKDEEIFK